MIFKWFITSKEEAKAKANHAGRKLPPYYSESNYPVRVPELEMVTQDNRRIGLGGSFSPNVDPDVVVVDPKRPLSSLPVQECAKCGEPIDRDEYYAKLHRCEESTQSQVEADEKKNNVVKDTSTVILERFIDNNIVEAYDTGNAHVITISLRGYAGDIVRRKGRHLVLIKDKESE